MSEGEQNEQLEVTAKRSIWKRWWMRVPLWTLGTVTGLAGVGYAIGCYVFSVPKYRGPISDHFNGEIFTNQGHVEAKGFGDFLRWITNRDTGPWREFTDAPPGPPPPKRVGPGELRVTFINHSTVLVQVDGVNILTDPVYSDRIGPANLVGPTRHRPPGIRFEDLPPIDIVLISHNHYDHLDVPTLQRLVEKHQPRIYAPLGNRAYFEAEEIPNSFDLDWWQSARDGELEIICVPAQHFSGRGTCDRDAALWGSFVVKAPGGNIYFTGDTGWGPHFEQIRDRYAPFRLAMIPIGAYRPRWFMASVHIDPQDAVRAHKLLGASTSMGIHYGTFAQADDGEFEPVQLIDSLLANEPDSLAPFWVLSNGEGRAVKGEEGL